MRTTLMLLAAAVFLLGSEPLMAALDGAGPGYGNNTSMGKATKDKNSKGKGKDKSQNQTGSGKFWSEFYTGSGKFGKHGSYSKDACCT